MRIGVIHFCLRAVFKLANIIICMIDLKSEEKIINFLLSKNLITKKKLVELKAKQAKTLQSLEGLLIADKSFTPQSFNVLKSEVYQIESADLSDITIERAVLELLSPKVATNYQMIIFAREKNVIKVGLVDPNNFKAHEAIEFLASGQGLKPEYYVISASDFSRAYKQYSGFKEEIGTAIESAKERLEQRGELLSEGNDQEQSLEQVVKTAPVAKIVSVIIQHAIDGGASDIHIEPSHNGDGRVRYRVDGLLHTTLIIPGYLYDSIVSRIKVLANLKLDETRLPQDGRIRDEINSQEVDLRISVLPTLSKEKIVMRILDTSAGVPSLAELGFEDYHIKIIERNIKKPFGIFLLTGPTGSGKTTTLYSILNILNSEDFNITTLEDPIEYYINGINQSQINPEIKFDFAVGLRSILRQDPNIIMVGEIRDNQTVELVIHAGLTGHLVFSTLHTNNAWGAIPRLVDMKAEPFLLSSTLNLVMAQRLVRKICTECKAEAGLTDKIRQRIEADINTIPSMYLSEFKGNYKFYRGEGCANCGGTGYKGRTVICEILEIGPELKDLISRDFTYQQIRDQLAKQHYVSMIQNALIKALKGETSIEEVMRATQQQ